MLEKLIKFVVLIAFLAAIPVLWWQSMGTSQGLKAIVTNTGISLFLFGLCYKLMGTWDLIPDWIPFLGQLDDSFAWVLMGIGALLGGGGYFLL